MSLLHSHQWIPTYHISIIIKTRNILISKLMMRCRRHILYIGRTENRRRHQFIHLYIYRQVLIDCWHGVQIQVQHEMGKCKDSRFFGIWPLIQISPCRHLFVSVDKWILTFDWCLTICNNFTAWFV